MANSFATLFEHLSTSTFVERYLHQLPIAVAHGAEHVKQLGTLEVLDAIVLQPEVNVERSRHGEWWPEEARPTREELHASLGDGWTIFLRHAERYYAPLGELAEEFQRAFQAPIDVQFFCTPAATEGFGWHYDVEDVFILQTHGSKTYRLRKNTVNPWPLVETTPDDLSYEAERSLAMECRLNAGDWLYIPPGYWHAAQAEELSLSLSVGILSTTAIDLLELLRPMLVESLRWRQRLPLTGELSGLSDAEARERLGAVFADLGRDLASQLPSEEFFERYFDLK
ncbi:MAG: cupin domain-containing protein [Pirellulales bacterium]